MTFLERISQPPTPNPRARTFTLPLSQVETERRLHCVRYDRCLDFACKANWQSFTCDRCSVREDLSEETLRDRAEGIRAAIANRGRDLPQDR